MEEILIEKVRAHKVLYDSGSHDYRDQQVRQTAWEEIGRDLRISGDFNIIDLNIFFYK